MIRTGIGALIVGVGELIYQLSQFVARVGGVGEAFRLLSDLASRGLVAGRGWRSMLHWPAWRVGGRG